MKFFLFILFLSLSSQNCVRKDRVPENILAQPEMTRVIWDLARADEFVLIYLVKDTSLDKKHESVKLYEQIFRIHGTSREQFERSLEFYQAHPDLLKPVMDSLKTYEKKIRNTEPQPTIPDSIRAKYKIRSPS